MCYYASCGAFDRLFFHFSIQSIEIERIVEALKENNDDSNATMEALLTLTTSTSASDRATSIRTSSSNIANQVSAAEAAQISATRSVGAVAAATAAADAASASLPVSLLSSQQPSSFSSSQSLGPVSLTTLSTEPEVKSGPNNCGQSHQQPQHQHNQQREDEGKSNTEALIDALVRVRSERDALLEEYKIRLDAIHSKFSNQLGNAIQSGASQQAQDSVREMYTQAVHELQLDYAPRLSTLEKEEESYESQLAEFFASMSHGDGDENLLVETDSPVSEQKAGSTAPYSVVEHVITEVEDAKSYQLVSLLPLQLDEKSQPIIQLLSSPTVVLSEDIANLPGVPHVGTVVNVLTYGSSSSDAGHIEIKYVSGPREPFSRLKARSLQAQQRKADAAEAQERTESKEAKSNSQSRNPGTNTASGQLSKTPQKKPGKPASETFRGTVRLVNRDTNKVLVLSQDEKHQPVAHMLDIFDIYPIHSRPPQSLFIGDVITYQGVALPRSTFRRQDIPEGFLVAASHAGAEVFPFKLDWASVSHKAVPDRNIVVTNTMTTQRPWVDAKPDTKGQRSDRSAPGWHQTVPDRALPRGDNNSYMQKQLRVWSEPVPALRWHRGWDEEDEDGKVDETKHRVVAIVDSYTPSSGDGWATVAAGPYANRQVLISQACLKLLPHQSIEWLSQGSVVDFMVREIDDVLVANDIYLLGHPIDLSELGVRDEHDSFPHANNEPKPVPDLDGSRKDFSRHHGIKYFLFNHKATFQENESTEFKALPHTVHIRAKIEEHIVKLGCAFANCRGGRLFLGINDDGFVRGIGVTDKQLDAIMQIPGLVLRNRLSPPLNALNYSIQAVPVFYRVKRGIWVRLEGLSVIVLGVNESTSAHECSLYHKKLTFQRSGSQCVILQGAELELFKSMRRGNGR